MANEFSPDGTNTNLSVAFIYEASRAKLRLDCAEIRGRAIESGDMAHAFIDPDGAEPKHVQIAIQGMELGFSMFAASLLKNCEPSEVARLQ